MKTMFYIFVITLSLLILQCTAPKEKADFMDWWRDARFGLFIHWGLYAIPAGEWNGETNHAEWIRTTAQIPIDTYDKFIDQFNPVNFNAEEWVRLAKAAGMKYIVITSKHHDGFCLFDSDYTDYDVMSTPFQRDILKELSEACAKYDIKMCWYHSIMDWHHPDYLPRRPWETNRSSEGADFDRYREYMKNQLKELTTNYGEIGVLWFDGEWENTWNHEYGVDLYNYVKSLQPGIIINNRVDKGRSGMEGMTKGGEYVGDFGTPEQEIPATGLPNVDWETCMTMNDHWGYNKNDHNWKSDKDLIQKLADIASKGGNFLLNIGPKADGTFPQESITRLQAIGDWMNKNGESIYGSKASPFKKLVWGRCTQKPIKGGTRLYLHVFEWPGNGQLVVPGIYNPAKKAFLLADAKTTLNVNRQQDALIITIPEKPVNEINSVVVLDIKGKPDVNDPPDIVAIRDIFIDSLQVVLKSDRENVTIRYSLDDSEPNDSSLIYSEPIVISESVTLKARCFREEKPVSGVATKAFTQVEPILAVKSSGEQQGIRYSYLKGNWDDMPSFNIIEPVKTGVTSTISLELKTDEDHFAFAFSGYIEIPQDDVYTFYTESDDGSQLFINDQLVVDNSGVHGMEQAEGTIALGKGLHKIVVTFFERDGGDGLNVSIASSKLEKQLIPARMLYVK